MELITSLITSKEIVEGIDSQSEEYKPKKPDSLVYANIFPFLRIPETQTKADTYILFAQDIVNINRHNPTYASYRTYIWVMAHVERMRMPGMNATRIDHLAQLISRMFHGRQDFGFSEYELVSNKEIVYNEKYMYRELIFECNDLRQPGGVK